MPARDHVGVPLERALPEGDTVPGSDVSLAVSDGRATITVGSEARDLGARQLRALQLLCTSALARVPEA